jgi:hypothetical protein
MLINLLEQAPTIHPYVDEGVLKILTRGAGVFQIGDNFRTQAPLPNIVENGVMLTQLSLADGEYHTRITQDDIWVSCRLKVEQGVVVVTINHYRIQVDLGSHVTLKKEAKTIWEVVSQDL